MGNARQLALEAQSLMEFAPFCDIAEEIRKDAVGLFLNPASDIDAIAGAHERIRAVETFMAAIQCRITAGSLAEKKDQHRGND